MSRFVFSFIVVLFLISTLPAGGGADTGGLTIERMYRDPRLTGIDPRVVAWSPDGKYLAFRWNGEGERFYDIWICEASGGKLRRLTDAATIGENKAELTRAEIDRMETMRRTGSGIFSFTWSPDGRSILFPLHGDFFMVDVRSGDVRRLFQTAASETDPAFSPDGGRIAFVRENDLWMMDLESGMTRQLTTTGSETLYNGLGDYIDYEEVGRDEAFWWSPDGARIAYVQSDVGQVRELLIPDYLGTFVEVRRQLRPVAGGANGIKRLGVLTVETGETLWIEPGVARDEYIVQVHWHPSGEKLLVLCEPRHLEELHFLCADPGSGSVDTLFTVRDDRWVNVNNTFVLSGPVGWDLYYTTEESGWNHIYRMRAGDRTGEMLTHGDWQVTALHGIDGKGRLWFTSTEIDPGQRHLFYLDSDGRRFRVTGGEGWFQTFMPEDCRRAAVRYSNPENPPDLYILESLKGEEMQDKNAAKSAEIQDKTAAPKKGDRGGGHVPALYTRGEWPVPEGLRRITHSPAAGFAAIDLPKPRYFTLRSRLDGAPIHALILLPPALAEIDLYGILSGAADMRFDGTYPAIVTVHGGGYAQSVTKGWRWRALYDAYFVNEKGYVLLDLDYRGSSGYGRDFRTDVHLALGGPDLEDEMTGLEFLLGLPFIDPERIGIWGWSYGGFMAAHAMLRFPDAFEAGAAVAPVADWRNYDTHYTEERLGRPQDEPDAYAAGSPVTHADSLRNHLLIIHGMGDDNVHFQDTVQLVDRLIPAGVDFEVMFYPAGRHGIRADASRIHLFRKITRHFERYLRGDPDAHCP